MRRLPAYDSHPPLGHPPDDVISSSGPIQCHPAHNAGCSSASKAPPPLLDVRPSDWPEDGASPVSRDRQGPSIAVGDRSSDRDLHPTTTSRTFRRQSETAPSFSAISDISTSGPFTAWNESVRRTTWPFDARLNYTITSRSTVDGGSGDRNGSLVSGGSTNRKPDDRTVSSSSLIGWQVGLVVGICCGVAVVLLVLAGVVYKCRSREEGSYSLDVTDNCSYEICAGGSSLSNGRAIGRGAAAGSRSGQNGEGRTKKRLVREWYV